jgi:hypothetical protein
MTSEERAKRLFSEAHAMGFDYPSQDAIEKAITQARAEMREEAVAAIRKLADDESDQGVAAEWKAAFEEAIAAISALEA